MEKAQKAILVLTAGLVLAYGVVTLGPRFCRWFGGVRQF